MVQRLGHLGRFKSKMSYQRVRYIEVTRYYTIRQCMSSVVMLSMVPSDLKDLQLNSEALKYVLLQMRKYRVVILNVTVNLLL